MCCVEGITEGDRSPLNLIPFEIQVISLSLHSGNYSFDILYYYSTLDYDALNTSFDRYEGTIR